MIVAYDCQKLLKLYSASRKFLILSVKNAESYYYSTLFCIQTLLIA